MNDDYLWDRSGADAEIEHLESVLSVFKYQPTDVPASEGKFAAEPKRPLLWLFTLRAAFASAAAAVIVFAIWSLASPFLKGEAPPPAEIVAYQGEQQVTLSETEEVTGTSELSTPSETSTVSETRGIQTLSKPNYGLRTRLHSGSTVVRTDRSNARAVRLTREEKYAYGTLMLALSITSSNLRLVQDSIDGVQDTDRVENQGYR